jgi:hypothetical protein
MYEGMKNKYFKDFIKFLYLLGAAAIAVAVAVATAMAVGLGGAGMSSGSELGSLSGTLSSSFGGSSGGRSSIWHCTLDKLHTCQRMYIHIHSI